MIVVAALLSLLIGLSLGLLGGGGSILTVPILVYVLGVEPKPAIATSLLVVGTTSAVAAIQHARAGHVRWRTGLIFGVAGMAGAYLGGQVARYVPPVALLVLFALVMAATALAMLRGRREVRPGAEEGRGAAAGRIAADGLVVGVVTGLVGAGGGFLVVPALALLGGLAMKEAIGTSLLVIALKSYAGYAGYAAHVPVDLRLAAVVTGSAVAGSFAGTALARRISPQALRRGFGFFVLAMAIGILVREILALLG